MNIEQRINELEERVKKLESDKEILAAMIIDSYFDGMHEDYLAMASDIIGVKTEWSSNLFYGEQSPMTIEQIRYFQKILQQYVKEA